MIAFTLSNLPQWQEAAAWLFPLSACVVAGAWCWHVHRSLDRNHKIHCPHCDYYGHPKMAPTDFSQVRHVCPECESDELVPVRARS